MTPTLRRSLVVALFGLIAAPARADTASTSSSEPRAASAPAQYRRITLVDGRVYVGIVLQADADGLMVELPQGRMKLAPEQVFGLAEVEPNTFTEQPPWRVVVVPFITSNPALKEAAHELLAQVIQALNGLPAVHAYSPDDLTGPLTRIEVETLDSCGVDSNCAAPLARTAGATLAMQGAVEAGEPGHLTLTLSSVYSDAPRAQKMVTVDLAGSDAERQAALRRGLAEALDLAPDGWGNAPPPAATSAFAEAAEPPTGPGVADRRAELEASASAASTSTAPPETTTAASADPANSPPSAGTDASLPGLAPPEPNDPRMVRWMAWTPVPGLPSLARRDLKGFAISWAVVVPSTALAVGLASKVATGNAQFTALSLFSYYAITAATNKVIGLKGLPAVGVAPTGDGGAMATVSGRLP